MVVGSAQSNNTPDIWKSAAPVPTVRAQLGVATVNGKIYAIGESANNPETGPELLNVTEKYAGASIDSAILHGNLGR